jgi:hypothetical protein
MFSRHIAVNQQNLSSTNDKNMCIVCSLTTNVVLSLGLTYQPNQADYDLMINLNRVIEQQVIHGDVKTLQKKINRIAQQKPLHTRDRFIAESIGELIEYNQTIYKYKKSDRDE